MPHAPARSPHARTASLRGSTFRVMTTPRVRARPAAAAAACRPEDAAPLESWATAQQLAQQRQQEQLDAFAAHASPGRPSPMPSSDPSGGAAASPGGASFAAAAL
eukprot:4657797-Prymnesium_polylepis.1